MQTRTEVQTGRGASWVAAAVLAAVALCGGGCTRPCEGAVDCAVTDAGHTDAGQSDAGEPDGGEPDAGELSGPCSEVAHDPVLGTAQLAPGFRVVESAPLSENAATGVVLDARGSGVYALTGTGHVHRLGLWPELGPPTEGNHVFDAVLPADRARQLDVTWGLESSGTHVLVAYRTIASGAFRDARVALFDTYHPEAGVTHLDAPGNETLSALGANFLVGGHGLGALSGTRGVYALNIQSSPPSVALAATYPEMGPSEIVRPGPIAHTTHSLTVLGYYLDGADRYSLRLVPPAQLAEAMSGGTPIALADMPELTSRDDVRGAVGFGTGVAVLHSRWPGGMVYGLGTVRLYPLTIEGGVVSVGEAQDVLGSAAHDELGACTVVNRLDSLGADLLVTLSDRLGGLRLVRISRE
jgi:hypothetical protein